MTVYFVVEKYQGQFIARSFHDHHVEESVKEILRSTGVKIVYQCELNGQAEGDGFYKCMGIVKGVVEEANKTGVFHPSVLEEKLSEAIGFQKNRV